MNIVTSLDILTIILTIPRSCVLVLGKIRDDSVSQLYGAEPSGILEEYNYKNNGTFPYIVSLERKGKHECGATVIKLYVVITAAHCVYGFNQKDIRIRAGTFTREGTGTDVQESEVSSIVIHENYNQRSFLDQDISLVFLETHLKLSAYVATIKIASTKLRELSFRRKVTILGWGQTETQENSKTLLKATAELMTPSYCKEKMENLIDITENMLCISSKRKNVGIGYGDSGGPLVRTFKDGATYLLGVASHRAVIINTKITDCKIPSIYADVTLLKQWIVDTIAKYKIPAEE